MHRYKDQTGAALIMLIGITAVLALLSATLVFAIQNQQSATAQEREDTQSFYAAEAALDTGVQLAKLDAKMSTTAEWLTEADLEAAFYGFFPADATVTYRVYDNLATVDYNIKWDKGGPTAPDTPDHMVWIEATVTSPSVNGTTTRARCLVTQRQVPFAEALPKAVTYSDTGIRLEDSSDIYAVNEDGITPDESGPPYQTSITAGGTWWPNNPNPAYITTANWAEVGRFTMNGSSNLAKHGSSVQSLGITTNSSVRRVATTLTATPPSRLEGSFNIGGLTFQSVLIQQGVVGFLSDYFDQAAQASLADESQVGGTPASAPAAPEPWSSAGFASLTSSSLDSGYTATSDLVRTGSGNLSINPGSTARTYSFRRLYVPGNLTISGRATITCTDLYVGGTLSVSNSSTVVSHNYGSLYVNGTGPHIIEGHVNVTTSSARFGGPLTISGSDIVTTNTFGKLYGVGDVYISGNAKTRAADFIYSGGNLRISNTSGTVVDHDFGLVYASDSVDESYNWRNPHNHDDLWLSGNVRVRASSVVVMGNFTISGATTALTNALGHVYVEAKPGDDDNGGNINWSGAASVTTDDWTTPEVDPQPMWMGRYWSRTGDYDDVYGKVWVPGNSGTSVEFSSTAASTMMCPLLCTTEKCIWNGDVTYGTRSAPMVFFFMCDNNGIYPQVFQYDGTGTYYGLMVINESTMRIRNGAVNKPSIQGAVFAGCPYDPMRTPDLSPSDIVLTGSSCIAYDQKVVGAIETSSLKTTTTITQIVPGSWQQLPVN